MMRARKRLTLGVATLAAMAIGAAGLAAADGRDIEAAQAPLSEAATQLTDLIEQTALDGLAGISIDQAHGIVDVYWKGEIPRSVKKLQADVKQAELRIHPARFSRLELDREVRRLMPANPIPSDINAVSVRVDGAGLAISIDPAASDARIAELKENPYVASVERFVDDGELLVESSDR